MELPPLPRLLQERYGIPDTGTGENPGTALPPSADAMLRTLLHHRSIRRFREEPLPEGTLELLVAAAQSASSSSNLQPWSVVAVQDPARKSEAATLCGNQEFIRQAPLFLAFCADLARLTDVSEDAGQAGEGLAYIEMFLLASLDTALAGQNAAIAAEALGLGICFVGGARNRPRELAELLRLPDRTIALFGMAVGWPEPPPEGATPPAIKPRLPLAEVLHRETYSGGERAEQIAAYDGAMRNFYEAQGMNITGSWSAHSARRVASPDALAGRHILREILEERGFDLR